MMRHLIYLLALLATTQPTTQSAPRDSSVDWLLGTATTAPTSQPSDTLTVGATPLLAKQKVDADIRQGTITLNDGTKLSGEIATTAGKPLRLWDEQAGEYHDEPMRFVKTMKAQIVWERDEKEWSFKESGSDVKVYTGRTYPARELIYVLTLKNGKTVQGGIDAPLYLQVGDERRTIILHKRDKGEMGQKLTELLYPVMVEFDSDAPTTTEPGRR